MCNNTITKDPTTPQMCRYTTLWKPGLESSRLHCLGCPSTDGLSTSTIHDNHWVGQAAFHRPRHWSVPSPAWVGRPAARRTNWTFDVKLQHVSYFRLTETINRLLPVVIFLNVLLQKSSFSTVALTTLDISQGSVATHLRCGGIFSDYYTFSPDSDSEIILKIG